MEINVVTVKQLKYRIERTEEALRKEHIKNVEISSRVPWGAGMRRVKVGPCCRRENELQSRLNDYRRQLREIEIEV
jgi:hypothetical protein